MVTLLDQIREAIDRCEMVSGRRATAVLVPNLSAFETRLREAVGLWVGSTEPDGRRLWVVFGLPVREEPDLPEDELRVVTD